MTTKEKVIQVTTLFGMKGEKAAELMGISYNTFKSKKNDNNSRHSFNEKNYNDLVSGIESNVKVLKTLARY